MQERELAFKNRLDAGIRMESELPHLVALEDDLLSTGILLYHLKVKNLYYVLQSNLQDCKKKFIRDIFFKTCQISMTYL